MLECYNTDMLINLEEYAKLNNVTFSAVRSAIHRGKITPACKKDGRWYIEDSTPWISLRGSDESRKRLYNIWSCMKQRCCNPKNPRFKSYGGRGITVCEEWRKNYTTFRDWSLANGYADGLEIDRKDNDKGYCPENCRWVTHKENSDHRVADNKIRVARRDAENEIWSANAENMLRKYCKKRRA